MLAAAARDKQACCAHSQGAAICSQAASSSLCVAVGPDGKHSEDSEKEELRAVRRGAGGLCIHAEP